MYHTNEVKKGPVSLDIDSGNTFYEEPKILTPTLPKYPDWFLNLSVKSSRRKCMENAFENPVESVLHRILMLHHRQFLCPFCAWKVCKGEIRLYSNSLHYRNQSWLGWRAFKHCHFTVWLCLQSVHDLSRLSRFSPGVLALSDSLKNVS